MSALLNPVKCIVFIINQIYGFVLPQPVHMFHDKSKDVDKINNKNENFDRICGKIYLVFDSVKILCSFYLHPK